MDVHGRLSGDSHVSVSMLTLLKAPSVTVSQKHRGSATGASCPRENPTGAESLHLAGPPREEGPRSQEACLPLQAGQGAESNSILVGIRFRCEANLSSAVGRMGD